ncbi:MAG: CBS domain-containing protein [Myxococcales bacterium]
MLVGELMTRNTTSVRADQTLADAAQLMWDCDCGALPVLDEAGTRPIGMITDRDICMATWSRGAPPSAIAVASVMSQDLVRCSEKDSIGRAESLMQSNQVRRLPVVDANERLIGILSLADIARATERAKIVPDGSGNGLAATLAGICRAPISERQPSPSI